MSHPNMLGGGRLTKYTEEELAETEPLPGLAPYSEETAEPPTPPTHRRLYPHEEAHLRMMRRLGFR